MYDDRVTIAGSSEVRDLLIKLVALLREQLKKQDATLESLESIRRSNRNLAEVQQTGDWRG